jgi:hypothetical protein
VCGAWCLCVCGVCMHGMCVVCVGFVCVHGVWCVCVGGLSSEPCLSHASSPSAVGYFLDKNLGFCLGPPLTQSSYLWSPV